MNTRGRTVGQIKQEAKLRDAIQDYLDTGDWSGRSPSEVRHAVREHVQADPELAWALEPAERPGGLARFREKLHLIAIPLLLLRSSPSCRCCSLALPVFVVILRLHERRDGTRRTSGRRRSACSSWRRSRITSSRTRSWRSATSSPARSGS